MEKTLLEIKIEHKKMSDEQVNIPHVYVDIDDTLVTWPINPFKIRKTTKAFNHLGKQYHLIPHTKNIAKVKEMHDQGFKIIIWSAGGETWATTVIKELGLLEFTHAIHSKPDFIIDDLKADDFMGKVPNLWVKND